MYPKFSIIIPIYKVEKYLHECVDSVLAQSFKDYEIILVDDGSPDGCPNICDEYAQKDSRIKVVHQANAGLACARNSGIQEAKGEYVVCIDSDDYLINNCVLEHIKEKTNTNPDLILYGYQKLFESDNSWGEVCTPVQFAGDACEVVDCQLRNNTFTATAWTKAVKLSLLRDNNIEFTPGLISEDNDWYLHLLCYVKTIECLSEPCVAYRQRPGSISHDAKINSLTDNLWILETWPIRFDELRASGKMRNTLMSALAYFYGNLMILFVGYNTHTSQPYKKRLEKLSYLLNYAKTPRAKIERRFIKSMGFNNTLRLLSILSKIKKRQ